jgi:phosphoribosylformimino-5-aminoimidazole carboxamide ribotide isomerase
VLAQGFTIFPAIDVLEGRVVRLAEGDPARVTVEGGDPVAAATRFAAEGASWLHLVDLDGAFSGEPSTALVARVAGSTSLAVQVGGGYRTLGSITAALEAGASRVIVGTAALDPTFLHEAARRFGEGLAVAVDVRDGLVSMEGWVRESELEATELARRCSDAGVRRLLVTSTRRDGSLAGPDLELMADIRNVVELPLIAAGGIGSLEDVRVLRDAGCEGAVVGSAIWRGRFTMSDAASLQR